MSKVEFDMIRERFGSLTVEQLAAMQTYTYFYGWELKEHIVFLDYTVLISVLFDPSQDDSIYPVNTVKVDVMSEDGAQRTVLVYEALPWRLYLQPANAGLASTDKAVGTRAAKLLNALSHWSWAVASEGPGMIVEDTRVLRIKIIDTLRAEGWRVNLDSGDNWRVLPPKE